MQTKVDTLIPLRHARPRGPGCGRATAASGVRSCGVSGTSGRPNDNLVITLGTWPRFSWGRLDWSSPSTLAMNDGGVDILSIEAHNKKRNYVNRTSTIQSIAATRSLYDMWVRVGLDAADGARHAQ